MYLSALIPIPPSRVAEGWVSVCELTGCNLQSEISRRTGGILSARCKQVLRPSRGQRQLLPGRSFCAENTQQWFVRDVLQCSLHKRLPKITKCKMFDLFILLFFYVCGSVHLGNIHV
jgi:hypothetical protein